MVFIDGIAFCDDEVVKLFDVNFIEISYAASRAFSNSKCRTINFFNKRTSRLFKVERFY